jgi:hypothetical protein
VQLALPVFVNTKGMWAVPAAPPPCPIETESSVVVHGAALVVDVAGVDGGALGEGVVVGAVVDDPADGLVLPAELQPAVTAPRRATIEHTATRRFTRPSRLRVGFGCH